MERGPRSLAAPATAATPLQLCSNVCMHALMASLNSEPAMPLLLLRHWHPAHEAGCCWKICCSAASCTGASCWLPACISCGCAAATHRNASRTAGSQAEERGGSSGHCRHAVHACSGVNTCFCGTAAQGNQQTASTATHSHPPVEGMSRALMGSPWRRAASLASTLESAASAASNAPSSSKAATKRRIALRAEPAQRRGRGGVQQGHGSE